ncbi:hypothetical protein CEXT_448261 [Caerostris extrusa]|uniref:Ycf15 n=1 Tax=Caerostris extrusa TaxID=172846 RepID=A0AAV4QTY2_CAEEX|nr:hypothetical protein CEXT_448261 [Caerostris extrusa]
MLIETLSSSIGGVNNAVDNPLITRGSKSFVEIGNWLPQELWSPEKRSGAIYPVFPCNRWLAQQTMQQEERRSKRNESATSHFHYRVQKQRAKGGRN